MNHPPGLAVVDHIQQTRDSYAELGYDSYRWAHEPARLLLSSQQGAWPIRKWHLLHRGGVYHQGQIAFHHKDDTSYRRIDTTSATSDLRTSHFAYDMTNARIDPNVVFPLDALRSMAQAGAIGSLTSRADVHGRHLFAASPARRSTTRAHRRNRSDGPDVVLLVPV